MIWLIFVTVVLIVAVAIIVVLKQRAKKQLILNGIEYVLDKKNFYPKKIIKVSKYMTLALDKTNQILAIIQNFNPKNPEFYDYFEIPASSIIELEQTRSSVKILYSYNSRLQTLLISPATNEIKEIVYQFYRNLNKKIIENKYSKNTFEYFSASDWSNSYVWAYDSNKASMVYYRTKEKQRIHKINLKKEHFIIDLKYNYLEAPIFGEAQQMFVYEDDFARNVFQSLYKNIKKNCTNIYKNSIFYDGFNNILYLSNTEYLICSILLNNIKDIYFEENRIYFTKTDDKTSQIFLPRDVIHELENFIVDYNIRKISTKFDAKLDKLINTTKDTKFIIDNTRKRLIYCANLNSLEHFNFIIMSFDDVYKSYCMKSGQINYVRIQTKQSKNLDITCTKLEIAQFIEAQVNLIVN